jgi:hypothetical protein
VSLGVGGQEEPTGEAEPAGPDPLPGSDMLKNGDLASSGTLPPVMDLSSSWYSPPGIERRGYGAPVHVCEVPPASTVLAVSSALFLCGKFPWTRGYQVEDK